MIPISDINPAENTPYITRFFIFFTIAVYILLQPKNGTDLFNFFYEFSAIPCEIQKGVPLSANQFYSNNCMVTIDNVIFANKNLMLSLITANFLHANLLHLVGNLWSFWIFGNNIEDKLGNLKFIIFLLLAAGGSIGTHIFLNYSDLNPIVGASGIVSALMGAYLYRFPNAKLLVLVPFGIIFPTTIKAKYFMAFWFASQVLISLQNNNISWEAHIGGFFVGYLTMRLINNR
ncbi:MAG: rhomboid family intramembrane serine protease [Candidatus Actinomarina sp.]|nr:rhomboid family intramembrane serine protease [Candidatus Actinomarina sp.]MDG2082449.1 rhomboid family intramembrane serine protease [Candidatus Actinomarina sp.]